MTFRLHLPVVDRRRVTASEEGRCYWSAGADYFLRKWGLVALPGGDSEDGGYGIVARGAEGPAGPAFWEGPLSAKLLGSHDVSGEDRRAGAIVLRLAGAARPAGPGQHPDKPWGRPVDSVRHIPATRGTVSEPYELAPGLSDPAGDLHYQRLGVPEGWKVLAEAREVTALGMGDDSFHPVVISDGLTVLCGLPLLDLAVEKMSMPACPDGYYAPVRDSLPWQIEGWLAELLIGQAAVAGQAAVRLHPWPEGKQAAFTLRHDYDRPIADSVLDDLLAFYRQHGVKASVGFLTRLLPEGQIARLREAGHEVLLHSEAADAAALDAELSALTDFLGRRVGSLTCHGGTGSAGHLGETLFRWCAAAGLRYTEQLGRDNLLPHPALAPAGGDVERIPCMVMSGHRSLDSGTAPLSHQLSLLAAEGPLRLASGGVFNVMNHPDIHLAQLKALIAGLDLGRVWCATHEQIVDWCRITKFDSECTYDGNILRLTFPEPLPDDLNVEVAMPGGAVVHVIPTGRSEATIPLGFDEQFETLSMPNILHSLGRRLERTTALFRKAAVVEAQSSAADRAPAGAETMEQPRRAALIVRSTAEADEALERLKAYKGVFRYFPADLRVFSLSGGTIGLPAEPKGIASFFHTDTPGFFDLVCVDSAVRLFDTAYGAAFVARAARLTAANGRILFPNWDAQHPKSGVRTKRLAELLGTRAQPLKDKSGTVFSGSLATACPDSVLTWYLTLGTQLVIEELAFRNGVTPLDRLIDDPVVGEFLLLGELVSDGVRGARSGDGAADLRSSLEDIVGSHAYLISGISYKSAMIRHIIDTLMPSRRGLVYGDVGGGFGALAAELLASGGPGQFSQAITRDIAPQNIILARSLYSGLYPKLAGRYKFSLGPAETFPLESGFDVLSFIGSLLYVDKAQLEDVVARAWQSIRPGGLLIVHENIKNPSFVRDYDVMFEASELNDLLSRHGEVRCFHSNVYGELPRAAAQNRALFRVLRKPT